MEKIDARKLSTKAQQEIRYQVIRLKKQGRKRMEISEITGIHPWSIKMPIRTVEEYLKRWGFTPQRRCVERINKIQRRSNIGLKLNIQQ